MASLPKNVERYLEKNPDWRKHVDLFIMPPSADEAVEEYPELRGDELLTFGHYLTNFGVTRLMLYYRMRRDGNTDKFSRMIASQRGPKLMTDSVFFQRPKMLADQFVTPQQMKKVVAIARRHGYNPGANDTYMPELARFQGDPQAFVPPSGGRNHIKRVCESRGWQCDGDVTTPYREPTSDPHEDRVRLAPDLVRQNMRRMIAKDPSLKKKSKRELREMVIAKHSLGG